MFANSLAVVLDRSKGLLIYFPVIVIAGPYLYMATKQSVKQIMTFVQKKKLSQGAYLPIGLGVGLLALLVTQLGFDDWSGSFGPNGRYMLVFLFALIFVIAKYINYKNALEISVLGLAGIVSALGTYVVAKKVDIYLDTGVDNIVTAKYALLKIFPLYPLVINSSNNDQIYRSIIIVLLIVVLNVVLYMLYTNKRIKDIFAIKSIR
jgi:hypothetical protein